MEGHEPGWDLIRTFLAVLEERSLSAAARRLGLSQPTVGRHVDSLEESLGAKLFVRSRHGLSPTEAALDLAPHAEAMASASAAILRSASGAGTEAGGVVRVTASTVIGAEVLPAVLARFREAYPRIDVELVLSNRTEDLLKREADIAVRMLRPTQGGLVARRIGVSVVGLFAHRDYAGRHGLPDTPEGAAGHTLIGPDRASWMLEPLRARGIRLAREDFAIRSDSELAQHALVRAGAGIGAMQKRLAERDPALVPVLSGEIEFPLEMWLVMHEDLRTTRRVRLLYDHLAQALSAYVVGHPAALQEDAISETPDD